MFNKCFKLNKDFLKFKAKNALLDSKKYAMNFNRQTTVVKGKGKSF